MTGNTAIATHHISKTYGTFRAVKDLSFEVYGGEIFAMLGPNGAGKSTTIRMILDILKPDTGSIDVLGGKLTEATKNRIGYLPEERGLYRSVPVLEMMTFMGTLKGLSSAEAKKRSMGYLERLDLAEFAKKKVSELSKGMQQKVQFAITVLHEPDLIIVDEPFSGLDPVNTRIIEDLLQEMKRRGVAVVMSTHQMYQVEEMADRLLMISKGSQKLYGEVNKVREQYALPAVIVEGTGDWSALPGVSSVEPDGNGRATLIHLKAGVKPDEVLSVMANNDAYHVRRFELAVPRLTDIFISVVEASHDEDQ